MLREIKVSEMSQTKIPGDHPHDEEQTRPLRSAHCSFSDLILLARYLAQGSGPKS